MLQYTQSCEDADRIFSQNRELQLAPSIKIERAVAEQEVTVEPKRASRVKLEDATTELVPTPAAVIDLTESTPDAEQIVLATSAGLQIWTPRPRPPRIAELDKLRIALKLRLLSLIGNIVFKLWHLLNPL
jgi:hypothetical protein